jgi:protein O-GlcNAc transferase
MTKAGRNAPCPCGSGRKYKNCCLPREASAAAVRASTIPQAMQSGLAHHERGELPQAEALYRQVLALEPTHPDALHLLGLIAYQAGRFDVAVDLMTRAIQQRGDVPHFHSNLGAALKEQGRIQEAVNHFRKALRLNPDFADAHNSLGAVLESLGDISEATAHFVEALRLKPGSPEAHSNLGVVLHKQGDAAGAIAHYEQALQLKTANPEAHNNLGLTLDGLGRRSEAIEHYQEALRLRPDYPEAHNNLGAALREQGQPEAMAHFREAIRIKPEYVEARNNLGIALLEQGDAAEAITQYQEALRFNPRFPEGQYNLGIALLEYRDIPAAIARFEEALRLRPDYPDAHSNLGHVLHRQGNAAAAIAHFQEALRLNPERAEAHLNMGTLLWEQGHLAQAAAHYREALRLRPDYSETRISLMHVSQHLCDWSELPELWEQTVEMIRTGSATRIPPLMIVATPTPPAEQLRCAEAWAAIEYQALDHIRDQQHFTFVPRAKERLRIGYLSTDFHPHPVAYLLTELLALHDREHFEVIAYSIGNDDDSPVRHRIVQSVDHFVELRDLAQTNTGAAARRIYDDGIDILVDLNGYTQGCRTEILALRPAPIQVSYLGYPGTMGAPFIDYLLTDAFLTPPDQQPFFAEQLIYLPDCYQVNPRTRPVADSTPSRAEVGLPAEGFVFCCFNNAYKLTPQLFTIWMRLLAQVPGSVLWLSEANRWVVSNLQREAASRDIDPARLIFAAKRSLPDYLVLYRLADLFLDTLPYNAGATASDALWMGLPVLTCPGQTYVSRMAGSLLTAVGLPELITTSLEEYEALALQLAQHPAELAALHEQLLANRSTAPLFDTPRFTQNLEAAYRHMWEDLVSKQTRLAG